MRLAIVFVLMSLAAAAATVSTIAFGNPEQTQEQQPAARRQKSNPAGESTVPAFSDADAVRLLDSLAQSLAAFDQRGFLRLFDAARMPDYPVFRDQVAEFFAKYETFRARYHLTEADVQGELRVVLADFQLEAIPVGADTAVRKNVQLRLIAAWDGKRWRIVDLTPRSALY
jgi:hypothetical protein